MKNQDESLEREAFVRGVGELEEECEKMRRGIFRIWKHFKEIRKLCVLELKKKNFRIFGKKQIKWLFFQKFNFEKFE